MLITFINSQSYQSYQSSEECLDTNCLECDDFEIPSWNPRYEQASQGNKFQRRVAPSLVLEQERRPFARQSNIHLVQEVRHPCKYFR